MDAKPYRPRAARLYDENLLPSHMAVTNPAGKTLTHQRHKSTPALSAILQMNANRALAAGKKVLGDANVNLKVHKTAARDDSEVGKASPAKIAMEKQLQESANTAALARPAARPYSAKSMIGLNQQPASKVVPSMPTSDRVNAVLQEPARKATTKKSTKVLRDPTGEVLKTESRAVEKPSLAPNAVDTRPAIPPSVHQQVAQEIHKTETVPLRVEKVAPKTTDVISGHVNDLPPAKDPLAVNHIPLHKGYPAQEQYDEVEEEEYFVEDGYTTARSLGLHGDSTGGFTTVLGPIWTESAVNELALAKKFVDETRLPEDEDEEQWDTSMVAEYGDEIFSYMRELEERMSPNPHYMDQQQEIQWSMRAVLMDWVIQVHQRFNLLPETLFLTVNYIDRFLSCKVVSLGKLQLVGATAIFVAAKYEEVQCPTISEIIYMVDGGYTAEELLKAERFMLSMLMFELGWPGPMSFLRRISKADDYDLETRTLAKYFLEVTIMDERFVGCTPSYLAAGAHCMARLMLGKGDWSRAHVHYSGYTYGQLLQLLNGMLECCEDPQRHHAAVFEKYMDKRYKRASTFVASVMQQGFQLPLKQHRTTPLGIDSGIGLW